MGGWRRINRFPNASCNLVGLGNLKPAITYYLLDSGYYLVVLVVLLVTSRKLQTHVVFSELIY